VAVADKGALDLDGEQMKVRLLPRDPLDDGRHVALTEFWIENDQRNGGAVLRQPPHKCGNVGDPVDGVDGDDTVSGWRALQLRGSLRQRYGGLA